MEMENNENNQLKEENTMENRQNIGFDPHYAPPNDDEIKQLRNTTEIVHSQLLKMEFDELVKEVTVKYHKNGKLETFIKYIRDVLMEIPSESINSDSVNEIDFHNRISMNFEAPQKVDLVGSYIIHTIIKSQLNLNLSFQIPSTMFEENDFMNCIYFDKRNLYLAHIYNFLKSNDEQFTVKLSYFRHDLWKPILILRSNNPAISKYSVTLMPSISTDALPIKKLNPSRNNYRRQESYDLPQIPTPLYSYRILEDMYYTDCLFHLHNKIKECPALIDAILIAKTWLVKRELYERCDTINGFLFSMIYLYLFQIKQLTNEMEAQHLFKVTLHYINTHDLTTSVMTLTQTKLTPEMKTLYQTAYPIVLLSSDLQFNIMGRISRSSYDEFLRYVASSLELFSKDPMEAYNCLFIQNYSFLSNYDITLSIPVPSTTDNIDLLNCFCDSYPCLAWCKYLEQLLSTAYGNRILKIRCIYSVDDTFTTPKTVQVGLLLNPDDSYRLLDKGPQANNQIEATAFRKFWGSKSELRRFKDGSILETVSWEAHGVNQYHIITTIAQYIIPQHFPSITADSILSINDLCAPWLQLNGKMSIAEYINQALQFFEHLSTTLKTLPLENTISHLSLSSELITSTSIRVPETVTHNNQLSQILYPISVIMEMSSDIVYPNDYIYFVRMKENLLLTIATQLKSKHVNCFLTHECIDIFLGNYLFRCYLKFPNEINFIKTAMKNDYSEPHLTHYIHHYLYLPYHVSLVRSLCSKYPSYSETVRLVKIWSSMQMNSYDFSNELLELLVGYTFINSSPNLPPKNVFLGFIRFLLFISNFSFQDTPIVIDNLNNFTAVDNQEITSQFSLLRQLHPNQCNIFLVTPFSKEYNWYSFLTTEYPRKELLTRFILLAKSSVNCIQSFYHDLSLRNDTIDMDVMKKIFNVNYTSFDIVISCNLKHCAPIPKYLKTIPFQNKSIKTSGKNYNIEIYTNLLDSIVQKMLIEYNPIRLLVDELNEKYSYLGFFLYDHHFNNKICIIFNPLAFLPSPFKISECSDTIPLELDDISYTIPNILEIINTIKVIGRTLITDIKLQCSPFLTK